MVEHVLGPSGPKSSNGIPYTTICFVGETYEMLALLPRLHKELEFQLDAANAKKVEWRLTPMIELHEEEGKSRIRCRFAVTERHK